LIRPLQVAVCLFDLVLLHSLQLGHFSFQHCYVVQLGLCSFKVTRLQGCKVTRLQGYKVTRSQGHKVTRSQGHKVTRSQGHKVTRSQGHKVTRSQGYKVTRLQGYKANTRENPSVKRVTARLVSF